MPGAFRHFLSEYKISDDFDPEAPVPETSFGRGLEVVEKPELQIFVEEIFSHGSGILQKDLLTTKALKEALTAKGHRNFTNQSLGELLHNMGYVKVKRARIQGDMHYIWKHRDASFDRTPEEEIKQRVLPPIPLT